MAAPAHRSFAEPTSQPPSLREYLIFPPPFSIQVTIWDPKAGKVLRMLKAHEETVKGMVFAPINQHIDTSVLASGGWRCILVAGHFGDAATDAASSPM